KGLFTVAEGGGGWSIVRVDFLGDNVSAVLADARDGHVFAALEHGHFGVKLHRTRRLGEPWEACEAPAYPKQPEGVHDVDPMGRTIPWTTLKLWALAAGGPSEAGLIWCGTLPGGLFCSRDRGESWELVRSLWDAPERKAWFGGGYDTPGIHSICVDPRDPSVVRVAVSVGGVWTTRDGGVSWACKGTGMGAAYLPPERRGLPYTQDPHCLVQCRTQPDRLWVQHHNGIFASRDGGVHWQEITNVAPSSFGFAVAVHPQDGATAWFVPAIKDELRIPTDGN